MGQRQVIVTAVSICAALASSIIAWMFLSEDNIPHLLDSGNHLSPKAAENVRNYLKFVKRDSRIDFRVIIPPKTAAEENLVDQGVHWFDELGVGRRTDGRGMVLLIAPGTKKARVEVSYALEPRITDLAASRLLQDYLAPYFRNGNWSAGIEAAIEGLVNKTNKSPPPKASASPSSQGSGGGGYTLTDLEPARSGSLAKGTKTKLKKLLVPQPSPRKARHLEVEVMKRGYYLRTAPLYDERWRQSKPRGFPPRRLREIGIELDKPFEVRVNGDRAISYYPNHPNLAPSFFRKTSDGWILFTSLTNDMIVHDYDNQSWYALEGESEAYLHLLLKALPMKHVELQSGRTAWTVERGP